MNSKWFQNYVSERTQADILQKKQAAKEARKKLIILPIVFTIMCGGLIAAMMANPNGNTSGVPVIAVMYVVLMLMSILLISKKKGDPTPLDTMKATVQKYVTTPELEAALDEEMTMQPLDQCQNFGICFTKSFVYKKFTDDSVILAPYSAIKTRKWGKDGGDYMLEFYDQSKKYIFGLMCNRSEKDQLEAMVKKYMPNIK